MKIKFLKAVRLTLEQKTDSAIEEKRHFNANQEIEVSEVFGTSGEDDAWKTIVFLPLSGGWRATGVYHDLFEVVG